MSEQRLLFEPQPSAWVDRLWRRLSWEKRREIIEILAEIARTTLTVRPAEQLREARDES